MVDEAHRQSGIGRALIRSVETAARQRGIDLFKVAVMTGNEAALRLYESDGFRQAEQVLYRRIPPG